MYYRCRESYLKSHLLCLHIWREGRLTGPEPRTQLASLFLNYSATAGVLSQEIVITKSYYV